MCGIVAILVNGGARPDALKDAIVPMVAALAHRGPDDDGIWIDAEQGIALGFRRLSIIDVSSAGRQPMISASGRYVIVFNGEAYNFEDLREELSQSLQPPRYQGHSDTEVVLACLEAWGLERAVQRLNGMFAFAVWDRVDRALHVVRDRMGVKPVYHGTFDDTLLVGSELKALAVHPSFRDGVDPAALAQYLRYGYVPAPATIHRSVSKLRPGSILTTRAGESSVRCYWSLGTMVANAKAHPFEGSDDDAVAELEALVVDAVRLRMIADVPLGVFLSGGIDSSLVTALMRRQHTGALTTFTVGFDDVRRDESSQAAAVASRFGTDHHELIVSSRDVLDLIPAMSGVFDEPFADDSQIPMCLVSRLARRQVTVCLSGDGGDELFGGYDHYTLGRRYWSGVDGSPMIARRLAGAALRALPVSAWDRILPGSEGRTGLRVHKFARAMSSRDPDALHRELTSTWADLLEITPAAPAHQPVPVALRHFVERMMFLDQTSWLPDNVLVKVDRASMAVGLEAREPLLDHRLVEFAWRLPLRMKLREGKGKWIMRRLLGTYGDRSIAERPKRGFALPADAWLRGPLREWAEALLDSRTLRQEGLFRTNLIETMWREFLAGRSSWQRHLWIVLMFQSWRQSQQTARHDPRRASA